MTGHEAFELSAEEKAALKKYLENGGFLFGEACCGRKGFDMSFREMIRSVLPDKPLTRIPVTARHLQGAEQHLRGRRDAGADAGDRPGADGPVLLGIEINGNYGVIYSPLGLAAAGR